MFCKTIKYEDFEGNQQEEKFYFNLTDAEIVEWITTNGDYSLDAVLNKMVEKKRGKDIIESLKDLIYTSYGEKSVDGKRFIKSEEVKNHFMESNAYSVLFMELITDAKAAGEFINGIIPKKMAEDVAKMMKENPDAIPDSVRDYIAPIGQQAG